MSTPNTHPQQSAFAQRDPLPEVDRTFWQRWSPRSFSKWIIPKEELETIFDAARWSPSCNNEQPWRFHTVSCDSSRFPAFLELLNEGNRIWAKSASLLGFILAKRRFGTGSSPNGWAGFDCGAAWMAMTLQANLLGYHSHAMGGVKLELICQALHVDPEEYEAICGFVIGRRDPADTLPPKLAKREYPSPRKKLSETWIHH